MEDDIYFVCIFCGAKARTREGLKIHTRIYHGQHEYIPLNEIIRYVDKQIEKMKILEGQGKYRRDWIVEDDPNLHDELVRANIIIDKFSIYNKEMITVDILSKALVNALRLRNYSMDYNDALEIAEHILNFFGFEEQIIENVLENDDREILYFLEDLGIIEFRVSTLHTFEGKEWNVSTVHLKKNKISELANQEIEPSSEIEISEIYEKLPEEVWIR